PGPLRARFPVLRKACHTLARRNHADHRRHQQQPGPRYRRGGAVRPAILLALLFALPLTAQAPSAKAAYEQANRFFVQRKFQESMNSLDEALRLDPNLVPALTLRAKLAMAIRR